MANQLVLLLDTIMMSLSLRTRNSNQSFLNVTSQITLFDCTSHTM